MFQKLSYVSYKDLQHLPPFPFLPSFYANTLFQHSIFIDTSICIKLLISCKRKKHYNVSRDGNYHYFMKIFAFFLM